MYLMSVLHRPAPHRRCSLRRLTADSLAVTMVGGEPVHRDVSNRLFPGDVVYTRPRQLRTEVRNGSDTVGVKRGGTWYMRNRNTTGIADLKFDYAVAEDVPVTGDWDGSGTEDAGFRRGITWYLRD